MLLEAVLLTHWHAFSSWNYVTKSERISRNVSPIENILSCCVRAVQLSHETTCSLWNSGVLNRDVSWVLSCLQRTVRCTALITDGLL